MVHCWLIEIGLMVADLFHAVSLVLHVLVIKVLQTVTGVAFAMCRLNRIFIISFPVKQ